MTLKKSRNLFLLSIMCWAACAIGYIVCAKYGYKAGGIITFIGMWTFVVTNFITERIYRNKKLLSK